MRWTSDKFPKEEINSVGPLKGNYDGYKLYAAWGARAVAWGAWQLLLRSM